MGEYRTKPKSVKITEGREVYNKYRNHESPLSFSLYSTPHSQVSLKSLQQKTSTRRRLRRPRHRRLLRRQRWRSRSVVENKKKTKKITKDDEDARKSKNETVKITERFFLVLHQC